MFNCLLDIGILFIISPKIEGYMRTSYLWQGNVKLTDSTNCSSTTYKKMVRVQRLCTFPWNQQKESCKLFKSTLVTEPGRTSYVQIRVNKFFSWAGLFIIYISNLWHLSQTWTIQTLVISPLKKNTDPERLVFKFILSY